jgi:drug/metabolite transporter (DMT)-like permease
LLAVVGTLGFAGRDLASRAAPMNLTTADLGLYGFLTVVLAGAMIACWTGQAFVWPNTRQSLGVGAAVGAGVFAYSALMKAMRSGAIATVTPFRYTRLIFGIGLGVVLFGEQLDGTTLLGALVVIASGLFIWWQGRQRTN